MGLKKHIFYWLHGSIMIVGLSICALAIYGAASGADRGHPPAIIFLPVVIIAWLILHVFLIFIQWLATQGNKNAFKQSTTKNSWPLSLIIFVILCSVFSLQGFAALAEMWYSGRLPIYLTQWLFFLVVGVSFVCMCGILLRKNWGRLMAGVGCILISGFFMYMAIRNVILGYNYDIGDSIYLLLLVTSLGYFGYHLLTSERIKTFIINN